MCKNYEILSKNARKSILRPPQGPSAIVELKIIIETFCYFFFFKRCIFCLEYFNLRIILNHEFWKISLDKKFEVLSDKQYFGRIESCILRNKDGQKTKDADQPTLRPDLEKRKDLEKFIQKRNARSKSTIKGNFEI